MKKTIAIFVSLDLYRYDLVLPTPAIRAAADGQSGDPMAVVVSIMSRACIENISSVILEALPECGRDHARRNGGGTMRTQDARDPS